MGDTDIEFDGELLAGRSTEDKVVRPDDRFPADQSRWTVVQIYRLANDKGLGDHRDRQVPSKRGDRSTPHLGVQHARTSDRQPASQADGLPDPYRLRHSDRSS
jgi:hypothetical protein